ncbi:related to rRNA processing protein EBP2 [Cephalotrichum gorgonifer]|uniref:Related to rRNA processing protein EBP2 n=1 Tax=Cephalotrichum gorgonifer TaxID=2041049 RepID=A0AAE8SS92_9PEZI|nr:related to rRNA processing protein EBP2 [Cephalotrichum gorgonifer]
MVTKSKLKLALAYEKGVDFDKLKEKSRLKNLRRKQQMKKAKEFKKKAAEQELPGEDEWEDEEEKEGGAPTLDLEALDDSDTSDSEVEMEEKIERPKKPRFDPKAAAKAAKAAKAAAAADAAKPDEDKMVVDGEEEEEEDEEEEEEDDIPVSDLEDLEEEDREDLMPHTRLTINNTTALLAALNRIRIPTDTSAPFATHLSLVSDTVTADEIPDVSDDLNRELRFYTQSRNAALKARKLLRKENVPFSRPNDYFAEMVKSDEHVEKIKQKLIEEATAKKASAEARKLRDLKKYGKQVQHAKLQERAKEKKASLEQIKALKRKRQDTTNDETHEADDMFDVAIDNELRSHSKSNPKSAGKGAGGRGGPAAGRNGNHKRAKKDEKYGFGGKKKYSKSGDAASSADLSGFSVKRNRSAFKGPSKNRPGKARRKAMHG